MLVIAGITFVACWVLLPIAFALLRFLGFYVIVKERECRVFVLFGKVLAKIDDPGLHFLWFKLGPAALIVNWLGKSYALDMRLDQQYLRSQPVNSEEGAPMGIGIWYEMFITNPVAYLFRNADPRGSLRANVGNAAVRCLSNMPLAGMLESRHQMSQAVRDEVSPKAHEWGYQLGSVYIRKVHFRDDEMIAQIEAKVVNRLRQVTSAIQQGGANQVSIIKSSADRQAAIEFAKAAALRPEIVGAALNRIAEDPEVLETMFEMLQTERLLEGDKRLTLVPKGAGMMAPLLAGEPKSAPLPRR